MSIVLLFVQCGGIKSKLIDLEHEIMFLNRSPKLIFITETWLDDTCDISGFLYDNYHMLRKDRNRYGGVVMILIDKSFNCAEINNNLNLYDTESA